MAFLAFREVGDRVLGPLIGLRQQHAIGEVLVDVAAQLAQERMRLGQILAVGALALEEVRNRIEAQAIDAEAEPEIDHPQHFLAHRGIVEVQIRLMREEAMEVVRLRDRIPRPIRRLEILEDDARFLVALGIVAPDVEVAFLRAGGRAPRALKPFVLIGGVIQHQLGDHVQPAPMRLAQEGLEFLQRAAIGMDFGVVAKCRSRHRASARDRTAAATAW